MRSPFAERERERLIAAMLPGERSSSQYSTAAA